MTKNHLILYCFSGGRTQKLTDLPLFHLMMGISLLVVLLNPQGIQKTKVSRGMGKVCRQWQMSVIDLVSVCSSLCPIQWGGGGRMPLAGHLWTLELLGSLIITGPIVMVTVGLIGLKVLLNVRKFLNWH